jgi:CRP-like cAMP-binding protein
MSTLLSVCLENTLLGYLPNAECNNVMAASESVELVMGQILCEAQEPYAYVYFPQRGFISVMTSLDHHPALEVGLIGREGMLGASLVLDMNRAPMHGVVQASGQALRMSCEQFGEQLRLNPSLPRLIRRYQHVLLQQMPLTTACIHYHEVAHRLARFLSMATDRVEEKRLHFTHLFLANLLGVRRSSITLAAQQLQDQGVIHYSRGCIEVLDRQGLAQESCACYAALNRLYQQMLD